MNKGKSKKNKKLFTVFISILLVLTITLAGGLWFVNYFLNKVNIADKNQVTEQKIDPEVVTDAPLPEALTDADTDIKENIEDNRLWYHKDIINVLLVGLDYGSSDQYFPRSDAVIIASLNKINKVINIVSLSRATYVSIPGHGHARLNAAYAYGGPDLLVQTVEQNYKVRIDNYISVDFEGFSKIVDALDGIRINLTAEELIFLKDLFVKKGIDTSSGAGNYNLDGELALAYARTRKIDSDKNRTQRQRNIVSQIINKAKASSVSQATKLLNDFLPLVSTNFSKFDLISQGAKGLNYMNWPLRQALIPHRGTKPVLVDGYEVLIFNWNIVKSDIHEQLYPGIEPSEPLLHSNN